MVTMTVRLVATLTSLLSPVLAAIQDVPHGNWLGPLAGYQDSLQGETGHGEGSRAQRRQLQTQGHQGSHPRRRRPPIAAHSSNEELSMFMELLIVSGVGPIDTLRQFDIPVVKGLAGVGQNMWDRVMFGNGRVVRFPTRRVMSCSTPLTFLLLMLSIGIVGRASFLPMSLIFSRMGEVSRSPSPWLLVRDARCSRWLPV